MSNTLAQELIRDVSEKIQPKRCFELWYQNYGMECMALSMYFENLVEFAWSHYETYRKSHPFPYDKLTFIKQLSENKKLHLYPYGGYPKYFITIIPIENGIYHFPKNMGSWGLN